MLIRRRSRQEFQERLFSWLDRSSPNHPRSDWSASASCCCVASPTRREVEFVPRKQIRVDIGKLPPLIRRRGLVFTKSGRILATHPREASHASRVAHLASDALDQHRHEPVGDSEPNSLLRAAASVFWRYHPSDVPSRWGIGYCMAGSELCSRQPAGELIDRRDRCVGVKRASCG